MDILGLAITQGNQSKQRKMTASRAVRYLPQTKPVAIASVIHLGGEDSKQHHGLRDFWKECGQCMHRDRTGRSTFATRAIHNISLVIASAVHNFLGDFS